MPEKRFCYVGYDEPRLRYTKSRYAKDGFNEKLFALLLNFLSRVKRRPINLVIFPLTTEKPQIDNIYYFNSMHNYYY